MIGFDCHAHVYEDISVVPGARYRPKAPAHLSNWQQNLKKHGLSGGVIVQVSFLGTDNSQLCAALAKLNPERFCGVAVVPLDVDDETLDELVKAGVRGLRWNLVRGATVPDLSAEQTLAFFEKMRTRNLNLEIHLEGPRLAQILPPLMDQGLALVVDHFGLPSDPESKSDPMLNAVHGLQNMSNLFFKFSGDYRTAFDLTLHAQSLLDVLPSNHVVWGSDWPHTQHEDRISYETTYRAAENWGGLVDNIATKTLYGIAIT